MKFNEPNLVTNRIKVTWLLTGFWLFIGNIPLIICQNYFVSGGQILVSNMFFFVYFTLYIYEALMDHVKNSINNRSWMFFKIGGVLQKQVFCKNRCSQKFRKFFMCHMFHRLESLFNKDAGPQPCHFISKRLQHRCFAVKIAKF